MLTVASRVHQSTLRCINVILHGIGSTARELGLGADETWVSVEQFGQILDADRDDMRRTFHDRNASAVQITWQQLVDRGLPADFPGSLTDPLSEPGRLSADGGRQLVNSGMPFGSDGAAHPDSRRSYALMMTPEIVDAPGVLAELSGQPATAVAIPFGSCDRHVHRRLRRQALDVRSWRFAARQVKSLRGRP